MGIQEFCSFRKLNLARIFLAGVAVYALFCAVLFFFQDSVIYQPRQQIHADPSHAGMAFEEILFRASDGVVLQGWYVGALESSGRALLFFHGNAGNISHRIESIRMFHELGLNVLIFDYRGYGSSEGRPSEEGFYLDGRAALGVLLAKGFDQKDIILFGRSLGGAVAARIASETPAAALILESSFTSLASMASRVAPLFPMRFLLRSKYATHEILPFILSPLLVIHSPEDEIVPFSEGRKLFEIAREPKEFLEISGDHNGGFIISGNTYRKGLGDFLSSLEKQ
jgi:hypothetical protein